MLFNSVEFIFLFLPITILLFFVTARLSNTLALFTMAAASLIFYMQNDWKLALIFVPSIIFNYFLGLIIHNLGQTGDHRLKTVVLVIALACNLFALAYYKYLDFSIRTLNWI